MKRPSWDEFYLGIAEAASRRGDCTRSKVGAVIVKRTSRGHLTSIGYNGVEPGVPGCLEGFCPRGKLSYEELPSNSNYSNCISTHAEINAFYNAQFDIEGANVYVTRSPCANCYAQLMQEGVLNIIWPAGYADGSGYYANLGVELGQVEKAVLTPAPASSPTVPYWLLEDTKPDIGAVINEVLFEQYKEAIRRHEKEFWSDLAESAENLPGTGMYDQGTLF